MQDAMSQLERFLHDTELPTLIAAGLAHAQFETVHPFLDGNGRVGRLLVTLLLCQRQVLTKPVLYLSTFLRRYRTRYFESLTAIRNDGAWEAWIKFFLDGIALSAREAADAAQRVHELRERDRARIMAASGGNNELRLLDELYRQPVVNAAWVERHLGVAPATANKVLERCEAAGVVRETTGKRRGRLYRYDEYVDLFDTPVTPMEQEETHAEPLGEG
jgi:Fic family protein